MKVSSHIMRRRLREVEVYFLNCLGARREELLSPLNKCTPCCIYSLMKERKPLCPGKV